MIDHNKHYFSLGFARHTNITHTHINNKAGTGKRATTTPGRITSIVSFKHPIFSASNLRGGRHLFSGGPSPAELNNIKNTAQRAFLVASTSHEAPGGLKFAWRWLKQTHTFPDLSTMDQTPPGDVMEWIDARIRDLMALDADHLGFELETVQDVDLVSEKDQWIQELITMKADLKKYVHTHARCSIHTHMKDVHIREHEGGQHRRQKAGRGRSFTFATYTNS